ncbi:MAG: hypothetical protein HY534_08530 [Chloroflexi bacterium]|nr:hypothetical protein [Chloroflexota bacterium]
MFDWLMFFSQLALWALVLHLYRTRHRAQVAEPSSLADEPVAATPADFDWERITFAPGAFVAPPGPESRELQQLTARLQALTDRWDVGSPALAVLPSAAGAPALRADSSTHALIPGEQGEGAWGEAVETAPGARRQREELDLLAHLARRVEGRTP